MGPSMVPSKKRMCRVEQVAAGVPAPDRRNVALVSFQSLPVFEPAEFLKRINGDVAVRADRD